MRAYGWARLAGQNGEVKGAKLAAKLRAALTPANRRSAARIVAPYTPAALRTSLLPIFYTGCGSDGHTHCKSGTSGQTGQCSPRHLDRYVYPRGAESSGVQGRVIVHFTLMPDGTAHLPYVLFGLPKPGYRFHAAALTSILRSKFARLPPGAQPAPCNAMFAFIERPFTSLSAYPRLERFIDRMRRAAHSGTSTEASDPAGMSHLRKVRARQPRRRCVRSEAGRPAARMRVVLSLAPVRGPGYNVSRTNDVPTAERAGSDARGVVCAAEAANG
ncbi:MAG: energy transducer TonB [Steroidobacteraceae bacterium]